MNSKTHYCFGSRRKVNQKYHLWWNKFTLWFKFWEPEDTVQQPKQSQLSAQPSPGNAPTVRRKCPNGDQKATYQENVFLLTMKWQRAVIMATFQKHGTILAWNRQHTLDMDLHNVEKRSPALSALVPQGPQVLVESWLVLRAVPTGSATAWLVGLSSSLRMTSQAVAPALPRSLSRNPSSPPATLGSLQTFPPFRPFFPTRCWT